MPLIQRQLDAFLPEKALEHGHTLGHIRIKFILIGQACPKCLIKSESHCLRSWTSAWHQCSRTSKYTSVWDFCCFFRCGLQPTICSTSQFYFTPKNVWSSRGQVCALLCPHRYVGTENVCPPNCFNKVLVSWRIEIQGKYDLSSNSWLINWLRTV